jgi:hypothetical protein
VLLHRLQQGRLGFGRRAVDLVGQHHIGEDRAFDEAERAASGRVVLLQNIRAGDVARHEIGRELDALEAQVQRAADRADQQGLGDPRHADQQRVAAAEDRDQDLFDHLVLAHDHPRQLLLHTRALLAHRRDRGRVALCGTRILRHRSILPSVFDREWYTDFKSGQYPVQGRRI